MGAVGLSGARIATVAHPIGGASEEALCAHADGAVEEIVALLSSDSHPRSR